MTWRRVKGYSDECGGEVTAAFRDSDDASCGDKNAFEIRVTRKGETIWAPNAPLCTPRSASKRKEIAEDIIGFFEHASCGRADAPQRVVANDAKIEASALRKAGGKANIAKARKLETHIRSLEAEVSELSGRKRKPLKGARTPAGFPVRFPSMTKTPKTPRRP